jgi:nicotinamidase-related amidase
MDPHPALTLDPKTTALVAIDLQSAIVARQTAPHTAHDVVARTRTLADALRAAGGTVIFVHVLIEEFVSLPADSPSQRPDGPLPPEATEIVAAVGRQPADALIAKRQWGAFYGTNLEQTLDRRGIDTILMTGIATNIGVESTARAAFDAGYALVFASDAMASFSAEWHDFSVNNIFPRMGRVRTSAEILQYLL